MNRRTMESTICLVFCLVAGCGVAAAQCSDPAPKDFNTWLNCRVQDAAKARISQRENTKQTETPSVSQSSTSLVDQSSATDLISAALNLSGLRDSSGTQQKSFSFTASGYALYATARNHDPLDPPFYNAHAGWRRFWFTLGQEVPDQNGTDAAQNERATIAGLKILLIDKRDLSHRNLSAVSDAIKSAAPGFAQVGRILQDYLYDVKGMRLGYGQRPTAKQIADNPEKQKEFLDNFRRFVDERLEQPQPFEDLLKLLSSDETGFINRVIEDHIGPEVDAIDVVRQEVEKIRKAPQYSIAFQSKTRKEGTDEYKAEAIFDYGLHSRVNLTLNGSFTYMDSKAIGADIRAASASGQLQFQVTPERTFAGGRNPIYFYLAGEGKWMSGMDAIGKIQTKIKIPITEGIELPISFTWANRTELIDERDVRGQFGFTFDLARLAKAIGFK